MLSCIGPLGALAQTPRGAADFNVREWHVEDGLPNESATQVLQDRRGFLWVATRSGLARFDGSNFVPVEPAGTIYLGMAEDTDGSLLLTPRAGDPVRYRDGKFTPEPLPAPYSGQPIGGFALHDGVRWYSVKGAVIRVKEGKAEIFGPREGISDQEWTWFARDGQGRAWLASGAFLGRYENGRLVPQPLDPLSPELRVASSRDGGPWVITNDRVLKLDANLRVQHTTEIPALLGAHYVRVAIEDQQGRLWLGTRSQGVHCVTADGHFHVPTSHDDVYGLVEDVEGNLWVGTNSGGLNAIAPKIYKLYNKSTGLLEDVTYSLCEDKAGDMWFANGDGGVARLNGTSIEHRVTRHGASIFSAISVAPAEDGGIWVTGSPGLFRARADDNRITRVDSVPGGGIVRRVSYTARNGDVWYSVDPDRVGRFRENRLQTFGAEDGFAAKEVRALTEDKHGAIWVGTADGQVFRFDGTRFNLVPVPGAKPMSPVNAILFGEGEEVWLGTARHGIVVLSGSKAVFIDSAHGLPDDSITQLVPDDYGHLWCGSSRGVFRLGRADAQSFVRGEIPLVSPLLLGKDEGLRNIACQGIYGPGAARSRDGRIWFATRQGVLALDPAARMLAPKPPIAAIEEVRCDDAPQALARPYAIPAHTRKLEIDFSVLCLSAPNRVRTLYRLEGFDSGWVSAGRSQTATYPRMPPGKYRFFVTAGFGEPAPGQPVDSVDIEVLPEWWQSVWFQLSAFAAIVLVVALIVRAWSHRRLKIRLERLERETAIVRERARIAQNIHDDVGASLTRISLLTQATQPETQPQAENLNRIYETTREITRSLDEIVWAVNPQCDTLESFAEYLADFAQKFLSVAGIRCRLDIPASLPAIALTSQTRHDLFLCCREALNNVVKHAQASEVTLRLAHTPPTLVIAISDNGRGMASRPSSAIDRVSAGHGLENMRRRMKALGGTCSITPGAERGITVTLRIDLGANGAVST